MNNLYSNKFNLKFSLPERPGTSLPEIPNDLEDMSDRTLMSLYTEVVAWVNYSKAELSKAEISEEGSLAALKHIETVVLLQYGDTNKSERVTMAKARRDVHPEVMDKRGTYQQSRAYRKLVSTVFDRGERNTSVLSRELSRRISVAPNERRTQWTNA
jgi:hypothetical protein